MPASSPRGTPEALSFNSPCPQTTPAGQRETTTESTPAASPRTPADSTHTLIKVLLLLNFGAAAMAALLSFLPAAGHDQLWFLLVARRWLAGATLYGPEIFDSNTPAVVWLSAIPILLAAHLHLPEIATAKLLVLLLELAGATLSLRILRRLIPTLTRPHLLWLAFSFLVIYACAPARDLGQRDQLTALLCLPYVLAAATTSRTLPALSPLRFTAGLLAAIGICLKPQQALIPLAIELTLLLRPNLHHLAPTPNRVISTEGDAQQRRSTGVPDERLCSWGWSGETCVSPRPTSQASRLPSLRRPEPYLILLGSLAFLAAVHHLTPLFFSLTLPTLLSTYWAIGHLTPLQLLAQSPQLTGLAIVAIAAAVYTRCNRTLSRHTLLLLIAGAAATIAYYLQGTGWYYQQLPAISFFAAALALTIAPLLPHLTLPRWLSIATAALAILSLALTVHFGGLPLTHDAAYATSEPDPALFAGLSPGAPVAILTTSVEDSMMPVERLHLTWAQRTNNLWPLPALLRQEAPNPGHRLPPARLAALTTQHRQWMLEDLLRWRPVLLLAERCTDPRHPCQNLKGLESLPSLHPDLLTPFLADPDLRALLRTHYRLTRTTPTYNAYTLAKPF